MVFQKNHNSFKGHNKLGGAKFCLNGKLQVFDKKNRDEMGTTGTYEKNCLFFNTFR